MEKKSIEIKNYSIDKINDLQHLSVILKEHIIKNNLFVKIANNNYVLVEGWLFAGGMLGLFPRIVKVEKIDKKWMAQAEIIDRKTDKVVSVGYALCSPEETKKKSFDEYAILSMAQTRAIGKAYRNIIGWVIKMAGYESTPAEEIPKEKTPEKETKTPTNYLEQLKTEVYKAGAKTAKEAVEIINKKTGLKLTDLKLTEKHAEIVLFNYLGKK